MSVWLAPLLDIAKGKPELARAILFSLKTQKTDSQVLKVQVFSRFWVALVIGRVESLT
jgi:hypothetical protein